MRRAITTMALAVGAVPAAAHDAPMALLETVERHQQECRLIDNYRHGTELRNDDWQPVEDPNPLIAAQIERWSKDDPKASIRVFNTRQYGLNIGLVIGHAKETEGKSRQVCMTLLGDLSFIPTTRLLASLYGAEVKFANTNYPGGFRDGWWTWESQGEYHKGSFARYTNSYFDVVSPNELPGDVIYPGFYLISEFTGLDTISPTYETTGQDSLQGDKEGDKKSDAQDGTRGDQE